MKKEFIYQVVNHKGTQYFNSVEELGKAYIITGHTEPGYQREELWGQPRLKGLLGGMYNGEQDGKVVIRYESQKVYDAFYN